MFIIKFIFRQMNALTKHRDIATLCRRRLTVIWLSADISALQYASVHLPVDT